MTIRSLVIVLTILSGYFITSWFVFGSPHPCEILLGRQKDYHIRAAERVHKGDLESLQELARQALPAKDYERFVKNLGEYSNSFTRQEHLQLVAVRELRQKLQQMSPAQCAWQAIQSVPG